MASSISFQGFFYGLHTNRCLNPLPFSANLVSSNPSISSANSTFGSIKNTHKFKSKHIIYKASLEGVPSELVEDPKFVPLNADDPRYGPPALLLLGFEAGEIGKIQQLLQELDGEFLKVIYCTEDMLSRSLWEAMNTRQPNLEAVEIAKSLPRLCFLSGLSGEEMMMFIDAFSEIDGKISDDPRRSRPYVSVSETPEMDFIVSGLEPAVFAALVPNSANKPLVEVMEEIMGDHEMMSKQSNPL